MSFLVGPLDDLVRFAHIGGVVLWVGLLHFLGFIQPRLLEGLGEGTRKELLPDLDARLVPWLSHAAAVTVVLGVVLYFDRILRSGADGVGWEIHLGSLLGLVMLGLTHGVIVPGMKRVAGLREGAAPPPAGLQKRVHGAAMWTLSLSWVVLLLMVLGAR